eukprot:764742-Hanusia_phi.AAC.3
MPEDLQGLENAQDSEDPEDTEDGGVEGDCRARGLDGLTSEADDGDEVVELEPLAALPGEVPLGMEGEHLEENLQAEDHREEDVGDVARPALRLKETVSHGRGKTVRRRQSEEDSQKKTVRRRQSEGYRTLPEALKAHEQDIENDAKSDEHVEGGVHTELVKDGAIRSSLLPRLIDARPVVSSLEKGKVVPPRPLVALARQNVLLT